VGGGVGSRVRVKGVIKYVQNALTMSASVCHQSFLKVIFIHVNATCKDTNVF
jgi:hypothetical protein